jgi:glycosyltransferase involved in cell wall biosynthesis
VHVDSVLAAVMPEHNEPALVCVYLPTKDRLALARAAIESVLAQTYRPIELIVVNDGSRDGTRVYLDKLAATNHAVHVIG